jgi:hypothetical protein
VQFNHGPKHDALTIKRVFGKLKSIIDRRKFKNEKKKKKGTCYNCCTKGYFVKECHEKKQDWQNKFKDFSKVAITRKTKFLVIALSIFANFRDSWFVDLRASQHLTF